MLLRSYLTNGQSRFPELLENDLSMKTNLVIDKMVKQLFNYVGYLPKPKIVDVPVADKDHDNMLNLLQ